MASFVRRDDDTNCGSGGGDSGDLPLRIASIFVIFAGSSLGAFFPVLSRRTKWLGARIPKRAFDTAKYFGSGVIIATAFIHLLSPAIEELTSPCLSPAWQDYPYALAIALVSIFSIFVVELVAFRWGTAKLAALGIAHDPHGHGIAPDGRAIGTHAAHGPEPDREPGRERSRTRSPDGSAQDVTVVEKDGDVELALDDKPHAHDHGHSHGHSHGGIDETAATQIVGVAILEFGVVLHSILIGLTLAVTDNFKILFIVLVFHQTFEGLGVGSRLAYMELPHEYNYIPLLGAALFGITTPIGIAIGLGVRASYNPESATASIVSGVLDAFSSGILIYTGLVELLAHEFLFNKEMINGSNGKLLYALGCMMAGCALMAVLGRWA
ncbi:ZIP zinc/iron transport family protein [Phanerochaete sordida]|uniref:ZIP zinc/iron transport family protein n=1 Tax=Phanerochaete sordida TaxID=48140 RepID=A0A9P3GCN9_9APHY|nr:ZIP zinc/iron transport family protein [Phanerochaete sordida]